MHVPRNSRFCGVQQGMITTTYSLVIESISLSLNLLPLLPLSPTPSLFPPFVHLTLLPLVLILFQVCTVQYFIWYFSLLPLLLPACTFTWRRGLALFALWFAAQGAWLALAFRLEFLGENTFLEIWMAGIGFFLANMLVVQQLLQHYKIK